jgi:hypothetical protein
MPGPLKVVWSRLKSHHGWNAVRPDIQGKHSNDMWACKMEAVWRSPWKPLISRPGLTTSGKLCKSSYYMIYIDSILMTMTRCRNILSACFNSATAGVVLFMERQCLDASNSWVIKYMQYLLCIRTLLVEIMVQMVHVATYMYMYLPTRCGKTIVTFQNVLVRFIKCFHQ